MYHQIGGVPAWDSDGYIPAIWTGERGTSSARAPYVVSLPDLVALYGHTAHRRRLLTGFLQYRSLLHRAVLVRGFQWIDGSFVRNVEQDPEHGHAPRDIDVVTLFYIPEGATAESLDSEFPMLGDFTALEEAYLVDAYYVQLNQVATEVIVERTVYWYSLWSHTDEGRWKGYLQVDLADDGGEAWTELGRLEAEGRTS